MLEFVLYTRERVRGALTAGERRWGWPEDVPPPPTQEEVGNRLHGIGASLLRSCLLPLPWFWYLLSNWGVGQEHTGCRGCVLR